MKTSNQHIVLIGFKHVGKSTIGKSLSMALQKKWIDLDKHIEALFEKSFHEKLSCRQIVETRSQDFFRTLETQALSEVVSCSEAAIISLGGGTPLNPKNQALIAEQRVIHITAPRAIVFEKIMLSGRPAFFSPDEDPLNTFNRLWNEREKVYQKLTSYCVENNGTVEEVTNQIVKYCLKGAL